MPIVINNPPQNIISDANDSKVIIVKAKALEVEANVSTNNRYDILENSEKDVTVSDDEVGVAEKRDVIAKKPTSKGKILKSNVKSYTSKKQAISLDDK